MIKSIAFILFFINLFPSAARDIYVSVSNGLDTNDGSKPTKALQTLQAAADMTRPGDTVWVDFGVYQSKAKEILRIRNSGSEKKWIVYKNISENKPILKIHYDAGIFLESVSYISIEGFEITQDVDWYGRKYLGADPDFVTSTGNGIVCPRVSQLSKISHHIKIQDCEIHSCPGSGIFLQCADYLTIQFNHIHHNGEMNLTNNSGIRLQQLVEFDQKEGIHNLINGNTVHHQRRSSRLEEEISFCEKRTVVVVFLYETIVISYWKELQKRIIRISKFLTMYCITMQELDWTLLKRIKLKSYTIQVLEIIAIAL